VHLQNKGSVADAHQACNLSQPERRQNLKRKLDMMYQNRSATSKTASVQGLRQQQSSSQSGGKGRAEVRWMCHMGTASAGGRRGTEKMGLC